MALVSIVNSHSGQEKVVEMTDEHIEGFKNINEESVSSDKIKNFIDNLNVSAETKVILDSLYNFTINVGEAIVHIGRKIVELIIYFANKYPSVVIGGLIGFIIGSIISSIPVIGWAIGWIVTPLATVLGLAAGLITDLGDNVINNAVNKGLDQIFGTFKNVKV